MLQYQLDAGLALLRLAAELSRDVARIADNQEMLNIWLEPGNKPNNYRRLFKFVQNSLDEEAVHAIYKFASSFGVHGHITDIMFSETIGTVGENSTITTFGVSNYGVLDAVHMWLMSFLPVHNICAKSFASKYFTVRPDVFIALRDYQATMNNVIQSLSAELERLKKLTK